MGIFERFYDKVQMEPNSGCWLWDAGINAYGYGTFMGYSGRTELAHRVSYQMHVGEIPDGLEIDHLCRLRCCVNPEHMEVVTKNENYRRGFGPYFHAVKTHCPKGHPYDGTNLYLSRSKKRHCRTCTNLLRRIRRTAQPTKSGRKRTERPNSRKVFV